MSLFNHNYSAIITKGLGNPACCSIIVAAFSLTGLCDIEIVVPPTRGGGGGGFYVPFPKALNQQTRMVLITIKFSETKSWRRSYVINTNKADIFVRVINFGNTIKDNIAIGINEIKSVGRRVVAIFSHDDK